MTKPRPMDAQRKAVIWHEWERGTPMAKIARVIDKPPATVFSYLQYHGGIRPRHRIRRAKALSLEEREEVSRGMSHGCSTRFIAKTLCRSPSTISREINKTADGYDTVLPMQTSPHGVAASGPNHFCLIRT